MCLSRLRTMVIILLHLGFIISGNSAAPYYPVDDIAINCGSSTNSTSFDGREWIGDDGSKSSSSPYPKGKSTTSRALHQYLSADPVPYMTARISRSQFTYTFQVRPGQKFVRLHFYPFSFIGFEVSKSFFSVKAGPYTLLSNFSAFLTADALGVKFFAKEFCVNVDDNQSLSITFSPSLSTSSEDVYAFINGIEIVSMPTGLYYSLRGDLGVPVVGENYRFYIANKTALEMVYRLNVGGRSILPVEDLGLYRSWSEDRNYLLESGTVSVHTDVGIKYRNIPTYVAPLRIYQTAWSVGFGQPYKEYNFTWKLPVNLGFRYLVRLHFCELESEKTESSRRDFIIFIDNQIAEIDENVIKWSGQNGFPVYMDYVVTMEGDRMEGKRDLTVAVRPKHDSGTRQNDAFVSGLEIFKLSNPDNNLAGPNPRSLAHPLTPWTSKLSRFVFFFGGDNLITACVTLLLTLVNIIVYQFNRWGTNSSQKNKSSPREEESCRHFSLAEIQLATHNFDDTLVIGNGGFGKVYKGIIDHGAKIVAIKRLKLESKQGALEFWTEIETLSTYRHINLVSLIGYCNEGQEMLLVYEYMANGTLADHLYKICNQSGNGSGNGSANGSGRSSLSWEQRLRICIGSARGLDYLHTGKGSLHRLIHRDVKSSNILLDEIWVAKISDFGLSKMNATDLSCTHISTDIKGTFGYLDPEYFMTRRLTSKSDVFAFGVVLFEVLCGRPAVDVKLEEEQHSLVLWAKQCIREGKLNQIVDPNVREQISPQSLKAFAEIANKCLNNSPNERPTMDEVVTSLEFALEGPGGAYLDTEEEDSNEQISSALPTKEENMSNVDHSNSYGVGFPLEGTKVPIMKRKDNGSKRGPTWGWPGNSLWRREKTSSIREESCREFRFKDIEEATDNFTHLIREDPHSKVFSGRIDDTMKTVTVHLLTSNGRSRDFLTEVRMLSQLWHINLVPLIGYCCDKSMRVLVYDHMADGNLYEHLHFTTPNNFLSWKRRLQICIDAARGLNYLHIGTKNIIVHGDVNPRNILLDNNGVAKFLNLGCHCSSITTISSSTITEKSDVCSFGIVLFEVLCGMKVIENEFKEQQYYSYEWAKDRIAAGAIDQVIDPCLVGKISPDCLSLFVYIAYKCLPLGRSEQPTMLRVLRSLELALELQESADAKGGKY